MLLNCHCSTQERPNLSYHFFIGKGLILLKGGYFYIFWVGAVYGKSFGLLQAKQYDGIFFFFQVNEEKFAK